MGSDQYQTHEWAASHREDITTRHTHQDALNDREFERLLKACEQLVAPRRFEARCICLLAGRLGLRAGEIAHLKTGWLDWEQNIIRIPQFEACDCGYCLRQARQEVAHNEALTYQQACASRWHPKTLTSARVVPLDVSLRVEHCLERFAERYDAFPTSRSTS